MCNGTHTSDHLRNRRDVVTQFTENNNRLFYLRIPVDPPYLGPPKEELNRLGLPIKDYYMAADVCKVLGILPETFRYRLNQGDDHEPMKFENKRKFTNKDI